MKKIITRLLVALLALSLTVFLAALVWLALPQPLLPEAQAAQASTAQVQFQVENDWLVFKPVTPTITGFIFYPGGKVPAAGYAPAAQAIAAQGYLVVIPPMPLNLAFFAPDRAADVQAAHPEIARWAIGGHSLGGSMAAQYAAQHPGAVQGLVFWASYSASDLAAQTELPVVSIYGSRESGRASFTSAKNRALLPPDVTFVPIEGGNHEQFGYYTGQANDPTPTIARADQQAQTVTATVALLARIAVTP